MAELKSPNELKRINKTANEDKSTGESLKVWNTGDEKQPIQPNQSIAGPGAAIGTPTTVELNEGINISGGRWNPEGKETKGGYVSSKPEPGAPVKGTGRESARIDKPYATLASAVKDAKTDM
jgi:hypothetical protein